MVALTVRVTGVEIARWRVGDADDVPLGDRVDGTGALQDESAGVGRPGQGELVADEADDSDAGRGLGVLQQVARVVVGVAGGFAGAVVRSHDAACGVVGVSNGRGDGRPVPNKQRERQKQERTNKKRGG